MSMSGRMRWRRISIRQPSFCFITYVHFLRVFLASLFRLFSHCLFQGLVSVTCSCLLSNHRTFDIVLENFFFSKRPTKSRLSHTADCFIDYQAALRTFFFFGLVRLGVEDSALVSKSLLPRAYFDDEEMGPSDRDLGLRELWRSDARYQSSGNRSTLT